MTMNTNESAKGRDGHPASSVTTEIILTEHNIHYRLEPNLSVESLRNPEGHQVRLIQHRAPMHLVGSYAIQMRQGAVFPAIVVNDALAVIDGNTRLSAALQSGAKTIPAYVCSGLSEQLARSLSIELNQLHGQRMTKAEIRSFVIGCVRGGIAIDPRTCSRFTGAKAAAIARWMTIERCRIRGSALGISLDDLADSAIVALAPVRLDRVFTRIVAFARGRRVTASRVRELVSKANAAASEAEAVALIDLAEADASADDAGCPRRSSVSALHMGGLLRFGVDDLLDVAPEKQGEAYESLRMVRDLLNSAVLAAEGSWDRPGSVGSQEVLEVA
jgi:hypothetical protein